MGIALKFRHKLFKGRNQIPALLSEHQFYTVIKVKLESEWKKLQTGHVQTLPSPVFKWKPLVLPFPKLMMD